MGNVSQLRLHAHCFLQFDQAGERQVLLPVRVFQQATAQLKVHSLHATRTLHSNSRSKSITKRKKCQLWELMQLSLLFHTGSDQVVQQVIGNVER